MEEDDSYAEEDGRSEEHWVTVSNKHIAPNTRKGYERNARVFTSWLRNNGYDQLATDRNVLLEGLTLQIFKDFMIFE